MMKSIRKYIHTMYRPSYLALVSGLTVTAVALCAMAVCMNNALTSGNIDVIYSYPKLMGEVFLRLSILLFAVGIIDFNEKRR